MIVCKPEGGISNRLKFIISCLTNYESVYLDWTIPQIGGVGCHFNDLFENKFDVEKGIQHVTGTSFIHHEMNTNNSGDKSKLDPIIKQQYIDVIKTLKPIPYITDVVNKEVARLPKDFTTVSVRTFRSFPVEYQSWGRHFKIELLFEHLDKIETQFLLTCDDTETTELIKQRYKDKVHTVPKRTKFGDFGTLKGMQDILIDQLIGSKSKTIYGTDMSSYPEMQWWLGLCQPEYINMKLHTR